MADGNNTRLCSVDGCENSCKTRGFCQKHYDRLRRRGTLEPLSRETGVQLMKKMLKEHGDSEECLLWPRSLDRHGYGRIEWPDGPEKRVHRVALIITTETRGEVTRHTCRNRHCFNPKHLEWGTPKDNAMDRFRDGTTQKGEKNGGGGKLKNQQALEIFHDCRTQSVIAAEYGISTSLVSAIKCRRVWTHITCQPK